MLFCLSGASAGCPRATQPPPPLRESFLLCIQLCIWFCVQLCIQLCLITFLLIPFYCETPCHNIAFCLPFPPRSRICTHAQQKKQSTSRPPNRSSQSILPQHWPLRGIFFKRVEMVEVEGRAMRA